MKRLALVLLLSSVACKKKPLVENPSTVEDPATPGASGADGGLSFGQTGEGESEPPPSKTETVTERMDRAVAWMTTGSEPDLLKARKLLEDLADDAPDDALVQLNLGVAFQRLGDLDRASMALARATRANPGLVQAWLYLGQVELQLGEAEAALRRFRTGIEQNPENLDLRVGLAMALLESGQPEQAIAEAKEGLAINVRSLPLYNTIGLAYLELEQLPAARFVYEKAETIPGADSNAGIQANFGWILARLGETYAAEYRLKKAVELDPTYLPGLVQLSHLYMQSHNWPDALPLLESAAAMDDDNYGVWMNLGSAYRGLGRIDDARMSWERALELQPSNPDPQFNLAILYGDDLKDYETAVARFRSYVDAGGDQGELAQSYIDDLLKEKKRSESRRRRDEDRRRKEAEREAERKLLEDEERKAAEAPAPEAPGPGAPAPEPETPEEMP